jgi:hypothetical protein
MRQSKTKSGRVPYGTECGPGCRCRVRSPLRCSTAPYYGDGARADARIRTSVPDPRLNPQIVYRILSKLSCKKNMNGSTKGRRGSGFLSKISHSNFSKSCWVRRESGSGSSDPDPSKNSAECKMQIISDPVVVRIRELYQN